MDSDFYEGQGGDPFEIIREDNRVIDNHAARMIAEALEHAIAPPGEGEGTSLFGFPIVKTDAIKPESARFGLGLAGKIEVGDYVKTLCLSKAVYGKVTGTRRKGRVLVVLGRTQPGAPLVTREASPENLDLHFKAGTLPDDLRGHYE